jgi:rhamnosyltransferase
MALGDNFGVAYAHNRGIEWTRAKGYAYELILDQDSVPAPAMVERLQSALETARAQGLRIAAAGPRYVDPDTDHHSYFVTFDGWRMRRHYCRDVGPGQSTLAVDSLISSGSLIPLEVLAEVGGMDEAMFIDQVDTDWYLRAKSSGYHAIGVCDAVMEHRLGSRTIPVRLLRERRIPVHSPLRLY